MSKKNNCANEDRFSAFPDHIIQHILSFLPSTKEAIRTTLLSKRWHNQWTRVPDLIFDSTGMSVEKFSRFIDDALLQLHDCSKIKKFQIRADYHDDIPDDLPDWDLKFRFAITKDVEELFWDLCIGDNELRVPEFVFEHASYVQLHMSNCDCFLMPNRSVSWANLKALRLDCCVLPAKAIENILSGSPSLESFQFCAFYPSTHYDIVSKSLKKLMLLDHDWSSSFQISCPNLEKLELTGSFTDSATLKLMNSSSLVCAHLNFDFSEINNILQQFKHVKELEFGSCFIRTLSALKWGADVSPPLLNNKSLTLYIYVLYNDNLGKLNAGIKCALRLSYVLEKLVIKLPIDKNINLPDLNVSGENYWTSNRTVLNCLVSHLKIVEISGLWERGICNKFILDFIEFLLKNARVLEKLVVILEDGGKDFVMQVSQKLLDLPRCSQHATVKLLCSSLFLF